MTKVAVAQVEPVFGDVDGNLAITLAAIEEAVQGGADIIVLPELVNTGYMFASRLEAEQLSEVAGHGPATTAWRQAAVDFGVVVVAGFAEWEGWDRQDSNPTAEQYHGGGRQNTGRNLYNSAFMALPDGTFTVYRKVHLWDAEALYFEPGNLGFPVVNTVHGRLGMMICYDGWFPESYRTLALAGVDLVCVPTNWVPIPGQAPGQPAMATFLTMASAHVNGMVVAAADRVGIERGQEFIGQSLIASHTGWPLAGPAPRADSAIIVADVDLAEARRSRGWGAFNNPLRDRRPEAYVASDLR